MAHTPGPWVPYDRGIGWEVHNSHGIPINDGFRETFIEADAHLIAALPELLAAAKALCPSDAAIEHASEEWKRLHAAIKRAEGGA